jgi:glycosyltransferase 2 family protein
MLKRRGFVIGAGVAVSAIFVVLALRGVDLGKLEDTVAGAQLLPWLPLALAIFALGYVMRGVRCQLLVRRTASISVVTATNIVVAGYGANNLLPARLGELVRAGMLAERAKMPVSQSLAVTFIERVLDGLAMLFLLVVASVNANVPAWMMDVVWVAAAIFGVATLAIVIAALRPRWLIAIVERLTKPLGEKWRARFSRLAVNVTNAGACLHDPRHAVLLVAYSIIIWCLESAIYVLLLPAFGIELSFQTGLIVMCVTGFGLLLPSSPGYIGPFHYFASQTVMVFGVSQTDALGYASLVHLAFFVPMTIAGACSMLWYGVALGSTVERARREADEPAVPAESV